MGDVERLLCLAAARRPPICRHCGATEHDGVSRLYILALRVAALQMFLDAPGKPDRLEINIEQLMTEADAIFRRTMRPWDHSA